MTTALVESASPSAQSALDAFLSICATSPTMQKMEAAAEARGWAKEDYPDDIRAGFLAESVRQLSGGASASYVEIYSGTVAEGPAYLIVSRREPLFASKLPASHSCHLSVFGFKGDAPVAAATAALGAQPVEPWRDEQGNEVHNWYGLNRFNARHVQMSKAVTKSPLAGPADLAGLALTIEFSENK